MSTRPPRLSGGTGRDEEFEHTLRNQIAIVIGYCELLLGTLEANNPAREDIAEMEKAARTAMTMLRSRDETAQ